MAPLGITAIARRFQTSLPPGSATVSVHCRHLIPSFQVESPNRLDHNRIIETGAPAGPSETARWGFETVIEYLHPE